MLRYLDDRIEITPKICLLCLRRLSMPLAPQDCCPWRYYIHIVPSRRCRSWIDWFLIVPWQEDGMMLICNFLILQVHHILLSLQSLTEDWRPRFLISYHRARLLPLVPLKIESNLCNCLHRIANRHYNRILHFAPILNYIRCLLR